MARSIDPNHVALILTDALMMAAKTIAKPAVSAVSRQLADGMEVQIFEPNTGRLFLPHYWAVIVNDGKQSNRLMVWFLNPADDPRLSGTGRYAVRRSDVRRLSPAQWRAWRRSKKAEIANGTIVIYFSRKPREPKKFFDNDGGMKEFHAEANRVGGAAYQEFARDYFGDDLLHMKGKLEVKL